MNNGYGSAWAARLCGCFQYETDAASDGRPLGSAKNVTAFNEEMAHNGNHELTRDRLPAQAGQGAHPLS